MDPMNAAVSLALQTLRAVQPVLDTATRRWSRLALEAATLVTARVPLPRRAAGDLALTDEEALTLLAELAGCLDRARADLRRYPACPEIGAHLARLDAASAALHPEFAAVVHDVQAARAQKGATP
jgi:hypothetical protein